MSTNKGIKDLLGVGTSLFISQIILGLFWLYLASILSKSEYVELKVYNIRGKDVITLVSNKLNQGIHTFQFDGKKLASGIYYYRIQAGEFQDVKKMILLR